jgi:hypothetical protein
MQEELLKLQKEQLIMEEKLNIFEVKLPCCIFVFGFYEVRNNVYECVT